MKRNIWDIHDLPRSKQRSSRSSSHLNLTAGPIGTIESSAGFIPCDSAPLSKRHAGHAFDEDPVPIAEVTMAIAEVVIAIVDAPFAPDEGPLARTKVPVVRANLPSAALTAPLSGAQIFVVRHADAVSASGACVARC